MKLIFFYLRAKKVFLLIKSIFIVLNLLDDDECISYSTLYLNFFHIILLWVLSTRSTPYMTNWEKKNLLAVTLFSFFLIFHILSIVIHVFFTQTLRSPKQKNCFFYFNWVAFCVGIINTLLGYHPFRTINHIASSLNLVYRSIQYETITFLNPNFLHVILKYFNVSFASHASVPVLVV